MSWLGTCHFGTFPIDIKSLIEYNNREINLIKLNSLYYFEKHCVALKR